MGDTTTDDSVFAELQRVEHERKVHRAMVSRHSFVRRAMRRYGIALYCVVYVVLSLECPTVLSFSFLGIVFVGLVAPKFVFHRCGALLMMYTGVFGLVRYIYGVLVAVGAWQQLPLMEEIGLRVLTAGQFAWVR